jgi:hypothetical protein
MQEDRLIKSFKALAYSPESSLSLNIWKVVLKRQRKVSLIRLWSYSLMSALSFSAFLFSAKELSLKFSQSGFYQYLSLFFSDSQTAIAYYKQFMLSLVEALPVFSLMLVLAMLLIFLSTLRPLSREIKGNYAPAI